MLKKTLILAAVLAFLVVLSPLAAAQQQVAATKTVPRADPFQSEPAAGIERGDDSSGFVYAAICYNSPGLNPNGGAFHLQVTAVTAPEWVEISAPTDVIDFAPPSPYLEQTESCSEEFGFELKPTIANNAPFGEQGEIVATLSVTADTDLGTYDTAAAGDYPLTFKIKVAPAPDSGIPGVPGGGNTTASTPTTDPDAGESPGPAPLMVLGVLLAFAAFRRRQ